MPIFDPIEKRLKAPNPEQQLPLFCAENVLAISQHMTPPSAAHWSLEHCHIAPLLSLKSRALLPLNSSTCENQL